MITSKELASLLNGREYGSEITKEESLLAKASNLVVIFGASDDLMEFEGAIYDEIGCYEGKTVHIDKTGIVDATGDIDRCMGCRHYVKALNEAKTIEAIWGKDGMSWQYKTDIHHEVFDIMEDREVYCRGIVFSIDDV